LISPKASLRRQAVALGRFQPDAHAANQARAYFSDAAISASPFK
jgi:hypothetical protein